MTEANRYSAERVNSSRPNELVVMGGSPGPGDERREFTWFAFNSSNAMFIVQTGAKGNPNYQEWFFGAYLWPAYGTMPNDLNREFSRSGSDHRIYDQNCNAGALGTLFLHLTIKLSGGEI